MRCFFLADCCCLFSFGRVWVDAASPWCSDWEDNEQRGLSRPQWEETAGCQSRESVRPVLRSWNYKITWSCSSLLTKQVKWQPVVAWRGILDTKKEQKWNLKCRWTGSQQCFPDCNLLLQNWMWFYCSLRDCSAPLGFLVWNCHSSLWSCKTAVLGMCGLNCCFCLSE